MCTCVLPGMTADLMHLHVGWAFADLGLDQIGASRHGPGDFGSWLWVEHQSAGCLLVLQSQAEGQ